MTENVDKPKGPLQKWSLVIVALLMLGIWLGFRSWQDRHYWEDQYRWYYQGALSTGASPAEARRFANATIAKEKAGGSGSLEDRRNRRIEREKNEKFAREVNCKINPGDMGC